MIMQIMFVVLCFVTIVIPGLVCLIVEFDYIRMIIGVIIWLLLIVLILLYIMDKFVILPYILLSIPIGIITIITIITMNNLASIKFFV